jgi:4-amino-4-deoxy-L-arabinose transferase-like glycosyltransferase
VEENRLVFLVAATVMVGLMTLCRPISLLWIIPQCFILLCETRLRFSRRLARVVLSIVVFAATLFPWYLRNRIQDGAWFLTTNTGYTLLLHNAATLEARRTRQSAEALRAEWNRETEAEFAAHPDRYRTAHEQNAYRVRRARALICQAPLLYARLHLQPYVLLPNITAFFELIGQTQPHRGTLDVLNRLGLAAAARHYFGDRAWLVAFVAPWIALLGLIYLGVCLGLMRWLAQRRWIELLLFLAFAVYYLLLPGPVTPPRFREPAMPMMILTAVAGFVWVFARHAAASPDKDA